MFVNVISLSGEYLDLLKGMFDVGEIIDFDINNVLYVII